MVLLISVTLQSGQSSAVFALNESEKTLRIGKSLTLWSRTLALPSESATTQLAIILPLL